MNLLTLPRINKVTETEPFQPAISIVMPFEPKMSPKSEIVQQLKSALDKVQREIMANHENDLSVLVMQKLRSLVQNLNFSTYKKSIAIYLSPVFEKVLYLDIPVETRITINEPIDIRDLISAKRQSHHYLLLVLSEYCSNVYLGKDLKLTKIKSNIPYNTNYATEDSTRQNAMPLIASDASEDRLKKILYCSDQGLSELLQTYPLPVFVIGSPKTLEYFQKSTSNKNRILEYTCSRSDLVSETEMTELIQPHIADWERMKLKDLRQQLKIATDARKLAIGIGNVWKIAAEGKGRLLLVERNYSYAAQLLESEDGLYTSKETYHKYSHIRDAVGDIVEIVLENGGDVEFVEDGFLTDYKQIALIQY